MMAFFEFDTGQFVSSKHDPKHLLTLSLSLCLFFGLKAQQDVLISYEHIAHLSIDDIQHRYKALGIPK